MASSCAAPRPLLAYLLWTALLIALFHREDGAAVGFGGGLPAKPVKKERGFGGGLASKSEEEKRRQRRLGKDPSTNNARKTLLSETAEQIFQIGDLELPLLVPAYVLDYKRFSMMVEAGAGTVSDIVWPAEQALAETLLLRRELWQTDGVCEIGAGLGLAGLVAGKSGAPRVLLTDRDALVLEIAQKSAARNGMGETVSTAAFDWGDRSSWPKPFKGLVVAADVLYDKEVVPSLVNLILHLDGPAILVEPDNIERQSLGSVQYFEEMLQSNGVEFRTEKYFNMKHPSSPMLIISVSRGS